MRTLADQAMKLHEYMIREHKKDVPLHACMDALSKAGMSICKAIDELKEYKQRTH